MKKIRKRIFCVALFFTMVVGTMMQGSVSSAFGEVKAAETDAIHYMRPYYCSNVTLFQGNPKESFAMMGKKYTEGFRIENSTWGKPRAAYNVEGFATVSFDVGHIDGGASNRKATFDVYLDQELVESYTLESSMMTQVVIVDTAGKKQLYVEFDDEMSNSFAVGNVIGVGGHNYDSSITKVVTTKQDGEITYTCRNCGAFYTEAVEKQTECKPAILPYDVSGRGTVYGNTGDNSQFFNVMGKTYYEGITTDNGEAEAMFNLNNEYTSFSFDVCNPDRGVRAATMTVYVNGRQIKEINLQPYMMPETVVINAEGVSQVRIQIGYGSYAIYNIRGTKINDVKKEHSFEKKVLLAASATATGILSYECKDCGAFYTEVLPKLEGNSGNTDNKESTDNKENTGKTDNTNKSNTAKKTIGTLKISKSGKTLTVKTIAGAKVKVSAKKSILGKASKTAKANKKGVVKIKFKKKIKKVKVKVSVSKSGYKTKTQTKKF